MKSKFHLSLIAIAESIFSFISIIVLEFTVAKTEATFTLMIMLLILQGTTIAIASKGEPIKTKIGKSAWAISVLVMIAVIATILVAIPKVF